MIPLSCFKAYDIRGKVPDPLSPELAFALGRAVSEKYAVQRVVLGHDARLSCPVLHAALAAGLHQAGARVFSLGMCGTEEIYDAASRQDFDAGIMITGSHNPADENGFKLVLRGARPVSGDSGLCELRDHVVALLAAGVTLPAFSVPVTSVSFRQEYVRRILDYTGAAAQAPLKIVADAGNGCAGLLLRELAPHLPHDFVFYQLEPNGTFPNGVPNPLLPEKRAATANAVRDHKADLGIAWDGDFDRCFFYDHEGNFIEGYYLVGLLASELLLRFPGAKIIYDPRVYWNSRELIRAGGGIPIMSKTGHAFMKERMRAEDAVYGGEMSAHHYFRDFAYCDSGMLPWLLVITAMQRHGKPLAELVRERMDAWPCSGEINCRVANGPSLLRKIHDIYVPDATYEDAIDGINLEFSDDWRFNLRMSNTEPLLRLNVESHADKALLNAKTAELLDIITKNS